MKEIDWDKRWTPVRRGRIFCSPGCGRGCTVKEFEAADASASALAAKLGEGWEPQVWENLGWHYSAIKKSAEPGCQIEVRAPTHDGGTFFVNGHFPDQIVAHTADVTVGLTDIVRKARADAEATLRALRDLE